jgi:cytochrome c oxidase assembly protein subunit 15
MIRPDFRKTTMTDAHDIAYRRRAIRLWLLAVAMLVFIMVLVGGATRLTESGLSIVEWQPITGTLPPLSDAEWKIEFEKYQAIPQYRERNRGMSLEAFKTIYWWEWTHRMLGRVIGAVFLLPFLAFLSRGWIEPGFRARLWIIFCLGALQGAVGWWMVKSGLAVRVSVAHERLAFHLTLACIIYAMILWTAQGLRARAPHVMHPRIRAEAMGILILVFGQIFFGALVAGMRGGLIYNTWPLIDGTLVPSMERLLYLSPIWNNFFDNVLTVQFEHRVLAYGLWLLSVVHVVDVALRRGGAALTGALALAAVITAQAGVGILILLHEAPLALSLLHQGMAIVVLTVAMAHARRLTSRKEDIQSVSLPSPLRS